MSNQQKFAYSIKNFTTRKSQLIAASKIAPPPQNTNAAPISENKSNTDPIVLPYSSKAINGVGLFTIDGRIHINDIDGSRPIALATKQAQIIESRNIEHIQNEIICLKNMFQMNSVLVSNDNPISSQDQSTSAQENAAVEQDASINQDMLDLQNKVSILDTNLQAASESIKTLSDRVETNICKSLEEESTKKELTNRIMEENALQLSKLTVKLEDLTTELSNTKEDIEELHDYVAAEQENKEEKNREIAETNKEISELKTQIDKYNYELALSKAHESTLSDRVNMLDENLLKTSTLDDLELIRQQISLLSASFLNMNTLAEEMEQKYFLLNERLKTLERANGTTHFAADIVRAGDIVELEESGKLRPLTVTNISQNIECAADFMHFDELFFCFSDKKIEIYDICNILVATIEHSVSFTIGDPILRYKNECHLIYCRKESALYVLSLGDTTLMRLIELPQLSSASPWINYNSISDVILVMWRPIAGLAYFCISERDSQVATSAVRQLSSGSSGSVQIKSMPCLHISVASFDNRIAIINPKGSNDVEIIEDYKDMDATAILDLCVTKEGNLVYLAENLVGGFHLVLCDILGNSVRVMHEIELNIRGAKNIYEYTGRDFLVTYDKGALVICVKNNILSIKYDYCILYNDVDLCSAPLYVFGEKLLSLRRFAVDAKIILANFCKFPQTYDFIGIAYDNLGNTIVRGQIYEASENVFMPGKKYYIDLKKLGAIFPENITTVSLGNVYFGISISSKKLLVSNI
jgi:hypothetical protein